MKDVGLITGASSGIGRALAHEHARRKRDLVVVARREDELRELAQTLESQYGVEVRVVAADLTGAKSRAELHRFVREEGIRVDYLFNNAGFGGAGMFIDQDWTMLAGMIELNITAVTELLHLFLPDMVARRHGRVLNTSSTAGFMPGPLQAVYFATKAYVNSISKALANEVSDSGVTVTALCPGAVRTEFAETAGMEGSKLMEDAATPESTAAQGYTAMEAGRLEVITDLRLNVMIKGLMPLLPDRLTMNMIKKLQST
jgi:short-subunit dehydrogenase